MPVKPQKDSFSISFEVKYISHGGGIGKRDEGIQYPAPEEVRERVQRLLQVVRDKKTEIKEAIFDSIEIKLRSIDVNVQKVTDPTVIASSAQRFMTELREREKYLHNCMTEAESCCCFETSKPRFLEKEVQEFDECLESFNRILVNTLEAEAKNSMKKPQSGTGDSSQKIPEKIVKFSEVPPPPPASAIQEQKIELIRSNAMPKTSENNSSSVKKTPNPEYSVQSISPDAKGQTQKHQSSNPTQKNEVKQQNVAHSGISSNTSRDAQPSKISQSGISSNTLRDAQTSKLFHSGISSNTSGDMQQSNFTQSISLNKPSEANKERDSAPVPPLKASGFAAGMQAWSVFNEKEDLPSAIAPPAATYLDKDSAKMPKLKEAEPIQQQTKPATVVNLKMEITHLQPHPAGSEIEPIQLQIKPAPVKNSEKESIQLQRNPPEAEIEPIQRQNHFMDRGRRFQ